VDAVLSVRTKEERRTSPEVSHIEIDTTLARERGSRFYSDIERAINDRTQLLIDYETIERGLTRRTVEPYFIIFRGRAFYFVAFCRLRNDFRTFRIDRVNRLRHPGDRFARKKGINARDYFDDSWRLYGGEIVEIVVRFVGPAARVIRSGVHHPREKVEAESDESVIYRVKVSGTEEIQRWILGFGNQAEVLEPESLRTELRQIGKSLSEVYSSKRS